MPVPVVVARLTRSHVTWPPLPESVVYVPSEVAVAVDTVSAVPINTSLIWCCELTVPAEPLEESVVVACRVPYAVNAPVDEYSSAAPVGEVVGGVVTLPIPITPVPLPRNAVLTPLNSYSPVGQGPSLVAAASPSVKLAC